MNVPKEIDNDDCKAALKVAASNPKNIFTVPDPISMGALLWHDLIEIHGTTVYLTRKGLQLLEHWHPGMAQTAPQKA